MRVCVVSEYYPRPGDPVLGVWAHRQALAARRAGAEVRVLVLDRPVPPLRSVAAAARGRPGPLAGDLRTLARQPTRVTLDGIAVEYVRYLSPPRGRGYASWHRYARGPLARALERTAAAWPFDLVHAHHAVPAGAAAGFYAGPRRVPLVVSVHGGDVLGPLVQSPAARATVGETLRGAATVLCNSAETFSRAAALAGSSGRVRIVHLGTEIPTEPPPKRPDPTVATIAHVIPRKRHIDVLDALTLLRDRLPRLRWLVIGDGPELGRLRAIVRERGLEGRVEFAGAVEPERALELLGGCHAMALPSIAEAFGVAYVEALAHSMPAIGCAGEGGPEEIAALGDGMVLVPPRSPRALAAALERVLDDPGPLAVSARALAARHFSWDRCGEATVAAYRDALA